MDQAFLLDCCKAAIREIRFSPKSLTAIPVPIDDKSVGKFLALVQASNRPADASWAAGIPWGEMRRYLELGEEGIDPYRELYDRFRRAQALAAVRDNEALSKMIADGKPEALKFRMKARHGWSDQKTPKVARHLHRHQVDPISVPSPRVIDNLDDVDQNTKQAMFFEMIRERQEEKRLLRQLKAGEINPADVIDNLPQAE